MKKHLRLLAWFLTLTMLCELLPLGTFAQSDIGQSLARAVAQSLDEENGEAVAAGKCGDNLTWSLSSDGTLTISGTGDMYDYYFSPGTITSRLPPWHPWIWDGSTTPITKVIIGTGVTSIGNYAFKYCSYLSSIVIPDSVTSIGKSTFYSCNSLTSIVVPNSVTSIGEYAFYDCSSLISITIPDSITSIGKATFDGCTSLTSIVIPDSVASIGESTFYYCSSLTDVYYSGTQEQWKAIDIDQNGNGHLLNATIHYQATGADIEKSFDFKKDKYSFINTYTAFFELSELPSSIIKEYFSKVTTTKGSILHLDYNYHLSQSAKKRLTASLNPIDKMTVNLASSQKWSGSCYGMSSTVFLAYSFPERFPLQELGVSDLYSLGSPRIDDNSEDFINYYQLTQVLPSFKSYKSNRIRDCKENPQNAFDTIITNLYNHTPVLVGLRDHAIVLIDILNESPSYYVITVCDPNYTSPQKLYLYKDYDSDKISISYPFDSSDEDKHHYSYIECYSTVSDLNSIDPVNFFGIDSASVQSSLELVSSISVPIHSTAKIQYGDSSAEISNGQILSSTGIFTSAVLTSNACSEDSSAQYSTVDLLFSKSSAYQPLTLSLTPDEDYSNIDFLLNDTLLSISTSGPASLTYNEEARTVDVTAENPTDVNILMTQNTTDENWPWHSWAIDTTGTTEFHAELKDDGLHLSGDGIANANYATENADTDTVDSGTIPDKAENVIITKKADDDSKTEIKDNTSTDPSEPTDPEKRTVTVVNGTITKVNEDVVDPAKTSVEANENDVITITADDRSAEGKAFREWVVSPENSGLLADAGSSTTTFTMGAESVTIEAQYDSTTPAPDPTPTPGGDSGSSSSGGGGGGGDGAAVILGIGAAAAITAGVILTMPVDVQGHVELADHASVPGAKISLLQKGNVVVQTIADESGNFSLKAKRGDYELIVVYTDANGQFVQKTTSIKAPAKDLIITF